MHTEEKLSLQLQNRIMQLGYPADFGRLIANQLHSERSLKRMLGYLTLSKSPSAEEIADELIAILEEKEAWKQKKASIYYNSKYNAYLNDPSRLNSDDF